MAPKKDKGKAKEAAPPPQAAAAAPPPQHPDDQCVLCAGHIDGRAEERMAATCNLCGTASMHYDCAVDYLQQCLPSMSNNSAALRKYEVLVKQRPKYFMQAEKVPCPAGSARAKRDRVAGCTGFTIDAEIYKPAKAPPAPLPQLARPAKQQPAAAGKKAAAPTGGVPTGRKHRIPSGSSATRAPAPFGAASTSSGSGSSRPTRPPPFAPAAAGGGGGGGNGSSFKGPRPVELTLCREVAEAGRCYIHNCRFAHSEEELQEREEEYAAERAARKQQAREAEVAAQRAAAQRALDEAATAQAVLDAIEEREMLLGISQPTLALVKSHKRAACLHTLLAYGFSEAEAENAVEAAGADQRLATQMLFDKQPCTGFQPVTVDREIQDLLTFAAELQLPAPLQAVEDQLVVADGDWEAAREALQAVALEAAVAAAAASTAADVGSWGDASWAAPTSTVPSQEAGEPASSFASSQPGTPNPGAAVPHWAADGHSAGGTTAVASPAAQSPHAPPSEATSDGGGSWHQPSSAAGNVAATPTAAGGPSNGAFGEAQPWPGQPQLQPQPHPQMHQQPGSPMQGPAGFDGFMPAPQHLLPSPAPFGSPVPLAGTLPQPAMAGHMPAPPAAYPTQLPPTIGSGGPSEFDHGFQAGLAAAMRQLQQAQQGQQAQQAQQFGQQAVPAAYAQHQPGYAQQDQQYQQAYGQQQYQQPYNQAPYPAQQQVGPPGGQLAGQALYQQPSSSSASYGQAAAVAPDAFFPAAQTQTQPWQQQQQQQAMGQPVSPHYQQQASAPATFQQQQLPPHTGYQQHQQGWEPAHAVPTPQLAEQAQHAGQDADDLDAMLSLMGIS